MFGKSTVDGTAPGRSDRTEQSFLQRGVRIEGNVIADGDLRIDGTVVGILDVGGAVTVGGQAQAKGLIKGREVVVHGNAEGTILADNTVHLAEGARVTADLYCGSLVIEEGVFFHGRSHMGEALPDMASAKELAARAFSTEVERPRTAASSGSGTVAARPLTSRPAAPTAPSPEDQPVGKREPPQRPADQPARPTPAGVSKSPRTSRDPKAPEPTGARDAPAKP